MAQRFNSSGASLGSFQVNSTTADYPMYPRVSVDPVGGFVVAWSDYPIVDDIDVLARRFDKSGDPVGGDFLVNTYAYSVQDANAITFPSNDRFLVVWEGGAWRPNFGPAFFKPCRATSVRTPTAT